MTFEEAYRRTGRVLNVVISPPKKKAPPLLLNYLSAPNVVVASAVMCSASVPGLLPARRLQYKDKAGSLHFYGGDDGADEKYFDGSGRLDIPAQGLGEVREACFEPTIDNKPWFCSLALSP